MRITETQLRRIIREEAKRLAEAGWGRYRGAGGTGEFNAASRLVKKATQELTGVAGAEEALDHLAAAESAIQAAWSGASSKL